MPVSVSTERPLSTYLASAPADISAAPQGVTPAVHGAGRTTAARARLRVLRGAIPTFSLYGEGAAGDGRVEAVHIEDIPSRSRKYSWQIGTHRHPNLSQCVFVTSGAVDVELDGSRTALRAPAAIIIPTGTVHGFRFRPETQGYVLTVDLDRLLAAATVGSQTPIQALFAVPRIIDLNSDALFTEREARLLDGLLQEFRQPESFGAPVGGWLACCVLWLLALKSAACAPMSSHGKRNLDRLQRFRLAIESHFSNHWPVARYARKLMLSETSLNRLCRRLTGYSAFDLVQQRMALEARRRLLYVAVPVTVLAAELGFKDAAYFCRFFRRHSGMSPGEYRRRHGGG